MLLHHKVALVTGASGGIGRAVALQCAIEGASVLVSDRHVDGARATADCLRSMGAQVLVVTADVDRSGDIQHLVERCCARFGRLDMACNVVGLAGVQGMRYQIEAMLRGGGGAVVNVTQATGPDVPCPSDVRHAAHRREAQRLIRHAALGHEAPGIRINTVAPGMIERGRVPTLFSATAGSQAERVAELVVWLASDRATSVSGAYYPVEAWDAADGFEPTGALGR